MTVHDVPPEHRRTFSACTAIKLLVVRERETAICHARVRSMFAPLEADDWLTILTMAVRISLTQKTSESRPRSPTQCGKYRNSGFRAETEALAVNRQNYFRSFPTVNS